MSFEEWFEKAYPLYDSNAARGGRDSGLKHQLRAAWAVAASVAQSKLVVEQARSAQLERRLRQMVGSNSDMPLYYLNACNQALRALENPRLATDALSEYEQVKEAHAALLRGEYICLKCGLRKNADALPMSSRGDDEPLF